MPGWFDVSSDWKRDENNNPKKYSPIKNGDTIMVLLEEIHIGDNKEWGKAAKITISFKFESKDLQFDRALGTFTDVRDHQNLSVNNLVILPPTTIKDYLTITVNVMEIDSAEGLLSTVPTILAGAKGITEKFPIPKTLTEIPFDIIGSAVNLAARLNEDDVIMRKQTSFFVDEQKYPDLPSEKYFYTGSYEFVSDEEKEKDRSHIILKFIRPEQ